VPLITIPLIKEERRCKLPEITREKAIELLTALRDSEEQAITQDDKDALTLAITDMESQANE